MRIAITILLAIFIPLAALMVVLTEPVCAALAHAAIEQDAGNTAEHDYLVQIALAVRDFSLGNNDAALPQGEDYRTAITPDALSHLLDVRTVFLACQFSCALLFIALVPMVIVTRNRKGARELARPLVIAGAIPLAATAVLGVAIAIDFSAFFTWIHGLFFADGTWTFPADSLLIRSLPYGFWLGCAAVWAGSMALFCLVSIAIGIVLRRPRRPKATHPLVIPSVSEES